MSTSHTIIKLSLIHAFAIFLGLFQQLILGVYFGLEEQIGIYFLSIMVSSVIALVYGESLQFSFMKELSQAHSSSSKLQLLKLEIIRAVFFSIIGIFISIIWTNNIAKTSFNWDFYFLCLISGSVSFLLSMWCALLLAWLQSNNQLFFPSLAHLFPSIFIISSVLVFQTVTWILISMFLGSLAQLIYLIKVCNIRNKLKIILTINKDLYIKNLIINHRNISYYLAGASLPLLSLIDRYSHAKLSLASFTSSVYAWAIILGLVNVISRGFNLILINQLNNKNKNTIDTRFITYSFICISIICVASINFIDFGKYYKNSDLLNLVNLNILPLLYVLPLIGFLPVGYKVIARLFSYKVLSVIIFSQIFFQLLLIYLANYVVEISVIQKYTCALTVFFVSTYQIYIITRNSKCNNTTLKIF